MILTAERWRDVMTRHGALKKEKIDPALYMILRCLHGGTASWPLLIHGGAGSGKTCAALLYCRHYREHGPPGSQVFITCRELCQRVADAKCDRLQNSLGYSVSLRELWRDWERAGIAVLDDISSRQKVSDSQYETLLDCLDKRQGWPTIYTSNFGRTELAAIYDDRIASRLSAGTVCEIQGDRRQSNPAALSSVAVEK